MAKKPLPRGIRNNNPGNIRHSKDKWQGLAETQTDTSFVKFADAVWGIRALARLLINYQDKHRLTTVADIINRWAPPVENDTSAYIQEAVRDINRSGVKVSATSRIDTYDYATLRGLVSAIINHENGDGPLKTINTWYPDDVVDEALRRAGVVKATKKAITAETVTASAAGLGGIDQLSDVVPQIVTAVSTSRDDLTSGDWVRMAIGAVMVGAAIYLAVSHFRKQKLASA